MVPKLVRLSIAALAGTLMLSPFLQGQAGLTGFLETFWGEDFLGDGTQLFFGDVTFRITICKMFT